MPSKRAKLEHSSVPVRAEPAPTKTSTPSSKSKTQSKLRKPRRPDPDDADAANDVESIASLRSGKSTLPEKPAKKQHQHVLLCDTLDRIPLLLSLVKCNPHKRIIVLTFDFHQAEFLAELFDYWKFPAHRLHQKQKLADQESVLSLLSSNPSRHSPSSTSDQGLLVFCDAHSVPHLAKSSRDIDFVLQFDPPLDLLGDFLNQHLCPEEGDILMVVRQDLPPVKAALQSQGVGITEVSTIGSRAHWVRDQLTNTMKHVHAVHVLANQAYRCWVRKYQQLSESGVYSLTRFDPRVLAKSFGIPNPPLVEGAEFMPYDKNRDGR